MLGRLMERVSDKLPWLLQHSSKLVHEHMRGSKKFCQCGSNATLTTFLTHLETEGPRVRASPASLRCGPRATHIYPSLVLVQPWKNRPC